MKTTIKSLSSSEAAPIFNWLLSYAFTSTPPVGEAEKFAERNRHVEGYTNFLVLYEGDTPSASAAAGPMTQNIRGGLVDMAGVFMVVSHPSQRHKGYSFKLLSELLKQMRERGNGFTCLYPFRESFYERLGYANLPGMIKAEINIHALKPLLKHTFQTKLELAEFIQQPQRYYDSVKRFQQHTHGMATFKKNYPPDPERHKAWVLTSERDGQPDGMLVYHLQGESPTQFKFNATRFYSLSSETRYHFLEWIARHIDQANEVNINLPAFEQPAGWYSDLKVKISTHGLAPMGRVLDIEKLNGLNAGEGSFSVRIIDPTCAWNEGSWRFEGQSGKLSVSRTKQAEDHLAIQGLSALVYGCIPPSRFKFRGWGAFSADVEHSMQSLFPPAIPYLHEYF